MDDKKKDVKQVVNESIKKIRRYLQEIGAEELKRMVREDVECLNKAWKKRQEEQKKALPHRKIGSIC